MSYVTRSEENGIVFLKLSAPPLNIITIEGMVELREEIERTNDRAVLALEAGGKLFSGGVSVEEHKPDHVREMIEQMTELIMSFLSFSGVTASLVHGGAFGGGCEIALCSDVVVSEKSAVFSLPEIKLGVFPPVAAALFPLWYPRQWVRELILKGREFRAERLYSIGIVNELCEGNQFQEQGRTYLQPYAEKSRPVLELSKNALAREEEEIRSRLQKMNRIYLERLMNLDDPMEGLNAFLDDRSPDWNHS